MLQELMSGSGRLSLSCYMAGQMVGCPIDYRYEWNLQRPEHQHLIDNIKSTVDFAAPNCGPWSCLSGFHPEDTKGHTRLSEQSTLKWLAKRTIQRHHRHGTATILENPKNSSIFAKSPLSQLVENPLVNLLHLDQCMHGACSYDDETQTTAPARKSTSFYASTQGCRQQSKYARALRLMRSTLTYLVGNQAT